VKRDDLVEYLQDLRRYARSLLYSPADAEDLVQDTLVAALDRLPLWLRRSKRRAWLFAIMHNRFINQLQQGCVRDKHYPTLVTLYGEAVVVAPTDSTESLRTALQALSVDDRSLLLLVAQAGFSYVEVARILDLPVGTVMSRLHRARQRLRAQLQAQDDRNARKRR